MNIAIQLNAVSKSFGRRPALASITTSIPAGSVVALVGPNAAGKTTLLNLMAGISPPSSGSILLFEDLEPGSRAALSRVAYVAQDGHVLSSWSVADAVHIASAMNLDFDLAFAFQRLERIGIRTKQRVAKLSGGQRSQLAITLALARTPQLLIMDEPLANLDPLARRNLLGELMSFSLEHHATIVFSSHIIDDVVKVADFLVLIDRGGTVLADSIDLVMSQHQMFFGTLAEAQLLTEESGIVVSQSNGNVAAPRVLRLSQPKTWSQFSPCSLEEIVFAYLDTQRVDWVAK